MYFKNLNKTFLITVLFLATFVFTNKALATVVCNVFCSGSDPGSDINEVRDCQVYADSSNPCNATGPGVSGWRWVATPHDCFGHTVNLCSLVQDTGCCPGGGSTCSDSDPSPSPLVLVSPANGSVVRGLTDVFDWNDVSGWGTNCGTQNNTYTIYIQKDGWSGAGAIVNGSSNRINSTTSSNYTHTVSQAGHVYYWQVEATNGARSVWSPVWSYTTDTVPYGTVGGPAKICVGQPGTYTTVIRDAQNNIKLTQIFRRLRTAANTAWEVGSSWILMNSKTCAPTSACDTTAAWTPLATDLGDIYRFAVNAYDSLDDGQNITDAAYSRCSGNTDPQTTWSRCDTSVPQNDYLDVTVGQSTAPIAPILLTPTNGSTNVILNPTFTWKAGLGADPFGSVCPGAETDTYHFQIRQCNILLNGTCSAWGAWQDKTAIPSTTLSTTSPIVLQQNTQYSWRVAANNGNAETWSQTANFWVFTTCGFTPPTAPTLKPTTFTSTTAHLSWNGILSTQWGGGCSALVKQYKVFIDSTASPAVATVNDGSPLVASYVGVRGTTHTWWVATYNGSGQTLSSPGTFTIPSTLSGLIWDSTGAVCATTTVATAITKEIQAADPRLKAGNPIKTTLGALNGNWTPGGGAGISYTIDGVSLGNGQQLCSTVVSSNSNFAWRLKCKDLTQVASVGNNCTTVDITSGTSTTNLGFDYSSTGWYTSLEGDVFAQNLNTGIPLVTTGGFVADLGAGKSNVVAGGTLSVTDSTGAKKIDQSGVYVESAGTDANSAWLGNFSFKEPTLNAIGLCGSPAFPSVVLDPTKTYKINSACLNNILLAGDVTYSLTSDGVAVVYVWYLTDSTITFGRKGASATGHIFKAANPNRKILFILEPVSSSQNMDLMFSKDLNSGSVTPASVSAVDAAFLVSGNVTFESTNDALDNSVVVDGPLVAKGTIFFNRDRGLNNTYPAEIVKYDPMYYDKLTNQSQTPDPTNPSGISEVNVTWQLGE